jgi:hypothetical protein
MQEARVELVSLRSAVAPLRVQHRARIHAVARWSLTQARPVPMDHVALIIAGKLWRRPDESELDRWTRTGVFGHLSCHMSNWCSHHRVLIPEGLAESLWTYLHFLADQHLLAPGSDPLPRLLDVLRCHGGLGPDGTQATRRTVVCRCYVEYRPRR